MEEKCFDGDSIFDYEVELKSILNNKSGNQKH